MTENTDIKPKVIEQKNYDEYSDILFQIDALRQVFNKDPGLLKDITLNNFYCDLLIKKYYLDVDVFKSYCPKASRDIDTISELRRAQKFRDIKNENADADRVGPKISTVLKAILGLQHSTSPIDAARDVLIDLNAFRLGIMWERTMFGMMNQFSHVMHPADVANGFCSVGFYVINVMATLSQAFAHKNVSNAYGIETSEMKFLELHSAKFMNDLVWAPINAFYFFNIFIASCRHHSSIGDAFTLVGFIFDIYMSVQEYKQTEDQYKKLIKALREVTNNTTIVDALEEQKTNKLRELQKNLSGSIAQTFAMLILLLIENLDNSALNAPFNLMLIAPIIVVSAKLILITYNFCERWNKAQTDNEQSFAITEFGVQMGQQMAFIGAILIVALVVMPHITAPTLLTMCLLMSSCLMFSYLINQLSNKIIDNHQFNPDNLIPSPSTKEEDDENKDVHPSVT